MANEILTGIADDMVAVDTAIDEATTLIDALKEAGEPAGDIEGELRTLKIRRDKWKGMLKSRGYKTG